MSTAVEQDKAQDVNGEAQDQDQDNSQALTVVESRLEVVTKFGIQDDGKSSYSALMKKQIKAANPTYTKAQIQVAYRQWLTNKVAPLAAVRIARATREGWDVELRDGAPSKKTGLVPWFTVKFIRPPGNTAKMGKADFLGALTKSGVKLSPEHQYALAQQLAEQGVMDAKTAETFAPKSTEVEAEVLS